MDGAGLIEQELEGRMRLAGVEELRAQTLAHELAMRALRDELNTRAQAALDTLVHQHRDDIGIT